MSAKEILKARLLIAEANKDNKSALKNGNKENKDAKKKSGGHVNANADHQLTWPQLCRYLADDVLAVFETHLRPALVSIAALHRVELPSKCNVEHIRKLITEHNPMPPTRHPLHSNDDSGNKSDEVPFQSVVITDVDGHASSNELRAAAFRHVKKKGGGYIQVPHDRDAENEFRKDSLLFPMIYPTLFPYGIGVPRMPDGRFQEHPSFLFTVFNIMQRRELLLHTSLKVKKVNFASVASQCAGSSAAPKDAEEIKVLNLLKQVNAVASSVPGSSAARVAMRNEIRGLMIEKGLPRFYITINPADIYNPVVKFLAGSEIDVDDLLPTDVPNYWD
ncbi:hypothetical protein GGX14DRAFT_571942 [Mycena pura]|uniref:Helitron helicase-like domain-containing protein n=1 Tax=Mycena pura TaxID=153505 RepID=A0AAD6Y9C2_9AGAR|nr:hypothetical protein GGX14DRAFT_571942 [Mycena pura]